jgi:hypothetical protein
MSENTLSSVQSEIFVNNPGKTVLLLIMTKQYKFEQKSLLVLQESTSRTLLLHYTFYFSPESFPRIVRLLKYVFIRLINFLESSTIFSAVSLSIVTLAV